ncbi:hypothetical protein B0T25DRAFT_614805 [Lasiosphaeria hispida]|uniref:Uncharacterized protein n=1 Tax=Lasiosphaeria hispida TaxID=260671 RepID=A0AAJ0H890_9PEZI|nr:hypothetical protein B0T25DRAFT_614805 [Lasiosphaeria hispida]
MGTFFIMGLAFSVSHCVFYASLNGTIVRSTAKQEENLRVGTALTFLAQITLGASIWQVYHQWIWRSVKKMPMKMATLNDIFGVETSVLSFLNLNMFENYRVGYYMALFAWSLILPPFFTPGTLVVVESTNQVIASQPVPYLAIANGTNAHSFSFSPSNEGDRYDYEDVLTRVFNGPRTTISLLSDATASQGEILSLKAPANRSSYSLNFFGPAVQCRQANASTQAIISDLVAQEINKSAGASAQQQLNAYYAFIPTFDSLGNIIAQDGVRFQSPSNASNEIWMAFEQYKTSTDANCDHDKHFQVCTLWNATYDLNLAWENKFQNVSGSRTLLHKVPFPPIDAPGVATEMVQHAYSAFFWVLADQLVGSFGWFKETVPGKPDPRYFGVIRSPIQHNSLLGSPDLSVFFDYNEKKGACQIPYANLSAQRQQDFDLAKSRILGDLIEELSFNMTVSFMHNDLLTYVPNRLVTTLEDVNRYTYNPYGIWIPYGLACFFTLITNVIGIVTFLKHGAMPSNKFQDILAAADMNVIRIARAEDSRSRSITAEFEGGRPTFKSEESMV